MSKVSLPVKPRALTLKVQKKIVDLIANGNYLSVACNASGLTYNGFLHWRQRWERGDPDAQEFDDFFRAVRAASAVAEADSVDRLRNDARGWQAHLNFLERRFPERWGKQDRTPLPTRRVKPLDQMTEEELARHQEEVEAARARP